MYKNVLYIFIRAFYKSEKYLLKIFNTPFINNFIPAPCIHLFILSPKDGVANHGAA